MEHLDWKWAFYISGIVVLLWTVLWVVLVYDSPEQHPWIDDKERDYIVTSLSGTVSTKTVRMLILSDILATVFNDFSVCLHTNR